ncbi:MAG: hypothetical protein CM15mP74_05290 [Halieaceae bacterium]|nr:MAG: hypothetical protein CM15mP74_05290 [Halieaceae bacterium]
MLPRIKQAIQSVSDSALAYDAMGRRRTGHEHDQCIAASFPANQCRDGRWIGRRLGGDGLFRTPAPLPVARTRRCLTPNAFLQVLPDNTIRFYTARSEMGQGVTTGLATLVGEELDVNPSIWRSTRRGARGLCEPCIRHAGHGKEYLHSRPLPSTATGRRQYPALILEAASQDLGVPVSSLSTENGYIVQGITTSLC